MPTWQQRHDDIRTCWLVANSTHPFFVCLSQASRRRRGIIISRHNPQRRSKFCNSNGYPASNQSNIY
eukprot:scaffold375_cov157-Amphora_coffeaeformis.AAC.2